MRIKFCNNKIGKVKSEKGFTLLELIFVSVVIGTISSTLILPFTSSIKQATRPEIYATATFLAVAQMERMRSDGYSYTVTNNIGTSNPVIPSIKGRTYTAEVVAGYVTHSGTSFSDPPVSSPSSEFIKVIVTIGNSDISNDVVLWSILIKDNYNPNAS